MTRKKIHNPNSKPHVEQRPKIEQNEVKIILNIEKLSPNNLFSAFALLRFYTFYASSSYSAKPYKLYESVSEEGPGVKKKIAEFESEEECLAALNEVRMKYAEYLHDNFRITKKKRVNTLQESTITPTDETPPTQENPGQESNDSTF